MDESTVVMLFKGLLHANTQKVAFLLKCNVEQNFPVKCNFRDQMFTKQMFRLYADSIRTVEQANACLLICKCTNALLSGESPGGTNLTVPRRYKKKYKKRIRNLAQF